MGVVDKLIRKIFNGSQVSFDDAKRMLNYLGYDVSIRGSHYKFTKKGFEVLVIKRRSNLIRYQINDLQEALEEHGYKKEEK